MPESAKPHLTAAASHVFSLVREKMPPRFNDDCRYEGYRTFRLDRASIIRKMELALRQPWHIDTEEEGYAVLAAVDAPSRFLFLKGSVQLMRRIRELYIDWFTVGRPHPSGTTREAWWDFICWRQLRSEGWGQGDRVLEAKEVVIPKGCAIIFSTYLIHAGSEWRERDPRMESRFHFYLTPFEASYTNVNMHRGCEQAGATPFSPALYFFPDVEADLPPRGSCARPAAAAEHSSSSDVPALAKRTRRRTGGT
jgi:hypothetical protein